MATDVPAPELLLAHGALVRAAARAVLSGDAEVEDVVQETWIRALCQAPSAAGPLRSWLRKVSRNLAIDARRKRDRRAAHEAAGSRPEEIPSVEAIVEREEARQLLIAALLSLDSPYREALLLRWYEELPVAQVAHRLDVPLETARTRLRRGLQQLRLRLGAKRDRFLALVPTLSSWAGPVAEGVAVKKFAVAALLLLLIGGFGSWALLGRDEAERSATRDSASLASDREASSHPALVGSPTRGGGPPSPGGVRDVGPDVDLAAVDRDIDLHGVVVRDDGSPVAGAEVRTQLHPGRRVLVLDASASSITKHGPSSRTSRAGAFVLRLRRGDKVNLLVTAAGLATQERPACLAGERVRIVMRPAVRLAVAVRDGSGNPVPGTRLRLFRAPHEVDLAFERLARSDDGGRAVFDDLPGPTWAWLEALPETLGSPPWLRVALPAIGEEAVVIDLPAGGTVTGRVTDAGTSAPLPGARVGMGWTLARAVSTDADGRYALPGWTANGRGLVYVLAQGYGRVGRSVAAAGVLDFELERGDTVIGRLVSEEGVAVAGARVAAVAYALDGAEERLSSSTGDSDAEGRFRLDSLLHALPHALVVLAEGRGRVLFDFDPASDVGGTVDLGDVVVPVGHRIEGRVVTTDGTPQSRVVVSLAGANPDRAFRRNGAQALPYPYGAHETSVTDDFGRFRFRDIASGSYTLTAGPAGQAEIESGIQLVDRDLLDIELRSAAGWRLAVRLVDSTEVAVSGVAVTLTDALSGQWHGLQRSGADGVATFLLPEGVAVRAILAPPPAAGGRSYLVPKPIRINAFTPEVTVRLEEAVRIAGRVLDTEDRPLGGIQVTCAQEGYRPASAFADLEGRFELTVAGSSAIELSVGTLLRERGRMPAPSPYTGTLAGVQPGATDLVLRARRLMGNRGLRLKVLDPEGQPAAGVTVSVPPEWMGRFVVGPETDAAGAVELADLLPRSGSVSITPRLAAPAGRHLLWQSVGPLTPDGQSVTVRLREAVTVSGVLLRSDGTPSARTQVLAHRGDTTVGASMTGEDGAFVLLLDPIESFPISLRAQDAADQSLVAELADLRAPATGLTLRLRAR